MTPALAPVPRPKLKLLELLKVNAEALVLVVPALTLMLEIVAALLCIAVVRNGGTPKVRPEVFIVPAMAVPADVVVAKAVPAYLLEFWLKSAVVRNAGTPRLKPEVFNVPTMAVPAVVALVNPVPA